jgi:endonuclease/exonuclease/phosphatase family metal-dependent hydrolase
MNTHFGLKKIERSAQTKILMQLVKEDDHHPIILSGDLNEWCPYSKNLSELRTVMNIIPPIRTFPARLPFLALDRIIYKGQIRLLNTHRHQSSMSRTASDHLPLIAQFELI